MKIKNLKNHYNRFFCSLKNFRFYHTQHCWLKDLKIIYDQLLTNTINYLCLTLARYKKKIKNSKRARVSFKRIKLWALGLLVPLIVLLYDSNTIDNRPVNFYTDFNSQVNVSIERVIAHSFIGPHCESAVAFRLEGRAYIEENVMVRQP